MVAQGASPCLDAYINQVPEGRPYGKRTGWLTLNVLIYPSAVDDLQAPTLRALLPIDKAIPSGT